MTRSKFSPELRRLGWRIQGAVILAVAFGIGYGCARTCAACSTGCEALTHQNISFTYVVASHWRWNPACATIYYSTNAVANQHGDVQVYGDMWSRNNAVVICSATSMAGEDDPAYGTDGDHYTNRPLTTVCVAN